MEYRCRGLDACGLQCPDEPRWQNQNGVIACDYHKLLLDAFNWETRKERRWQELNSQQAESQYAVVE